MVMLLVSMNAGLFTLPRSGFVQQVKALGIGKAVTFFCSKKAANFTNPVFEALYFSCTI